MMKFSITMPVKVHIIIHHLSDYFEMTGNTLRNSTDQVVEAAHHKIKQFLDNHPNYNHLDKATEEYRMAVLAAIIHFNSNNLGTV